MNRAAQAIWTALGREAAATPAIEQRGPEAALPSCFHVTELAAGAVGVTTALAAELQTQRDGRDRPVGVDRRHAAVAFRSERHVTIDGEPPPSPWDAASGYYRTGDDGVLQVHANFPHHRAGVLAALGLTDPGDDGVAAALADAIAGRAAQELEDELTARGMVVSRLRTPGEWAEHPHAAAISGLPVVEVIRVGDAPPEEPVGGGGAVDGLRVADLTRVIAGPVCGRTLSAHGADVLRVGAPHLPVVGPIIADTNLGKRWTDLDLRRSEDDATFRKLVAEADVVVQGYRPGALPGLGFDVADLVAQRPGLVVASLSAYSHVGPWAAKRGFDSLVQTATGVGAAGAAAAGVEGTRPLPAQALDHGAGWILAAGIMEALRRRTEEGGSWLVRTSLVQVRDLLVGLGPADHLDIGDPTDVGDLLGEVDGPGGRVGHIRLPGEIDGQGTAWPFSGPRTATDPPTWSPS